MSTYHVLLLYPKEVANEYGETYLSDPIEAPNHYVAIQKAKDACNESNGWLDDEAVDFIVLLVVKGGEII